MKRHFSSVAGLALGAALLTGCATGGAKQPLNATKFDTENHSNFVLLDSGVQRSVTCSGLQPGTTSDGRLEVAANIRNRESRRIQVQINCEFKDEQGFAVDSTPFETLILRENEQTTVRFTAMNNKAKTFTIRVGEAH